MAERKKQQYHLRMFLEKDSTILQETLFDLSKSANRLPPQLLIGDNSTPAFSFGTFRRHFIALNPYLAKFLTKCLQRNQTELHTSTQVVLAHELAHFINRDVQLAGLARSLLRMTILVTTVYMWVSVILVAL